MKATTIVLLACAVIMANWIFAKGDEDNEKKHVSGRFRRQCPTGLWCGKKRTVNKAIPNNLNKLVKRLSCPTGLWCGKKREINGAASSKAIPKSFKILTRSLDCPTGLWCGKKRSLYPGTSKTQAKTGLSLPIFMTQQREPNSNFVESPKGYPIVKNEDLENKIQL